jgi:hypothetical protein
VTDALHFIKEAVRRVVMTRPAPDAAAKARAQDGGVLVWFEDAAAITCCRRPTLRFRVEPTRS